MIAASLAPLGWDGTVGDVAPKGTLLSGSRQRLCRFNCPGPNPLLQRLEPARVPMGNPVQLRNSAGGGAVLQLAGQTRPAWAPLAGVVLELPRKKRCWRPAASKTHHCPPLAPGPQLGVIDVDLRRRRFVLRGRTWYTSTADQSP